MKIAEWIDKLSTHFGTPQDDEQIKIFIHALERNTSYQIDQAFERCLNECQFMPKLSEVHHRMPEEKWPRENPAAFVTSGPNVLDLVRPIAIEICKANTGREYEELDTIQDAPLIHQVFAEANRERYRRSTRT